MTRDELIARIKQAAYLEGDFTLRSGKKSKYYLDKYRFETQPDILATLGAMFAERIPHGTDRLAGPELGGVALAAATSLAGGLPFVIVRNAKKDYGTANQYEGVLDKGESVLLLEDIATTGGQVLEAAKTLTEFGCKVNGILAVIDRLEGARENIEAQGYSFDTLLTRDDLGIPS